MCLRTPVPSFPGKTQAAFGVPGNSLIGEQVLESALAFGNEDSG
jgi:hypothetical protein